jgi:hypothetical protein
MRQIFFLVSSFLAATAVVLSTGSAAFAMRVVPPGGSPVNSVATVHHAGGVSGWEVAVIAVAGLVVLGALALTVRFKTVSHRRSPTPAPS